MATTAGSAAGVAPRAPAFRPKAPPIVPTVPALPGLPVLGNLFAFRRDRLAIHDDAALLGPIARFQIGPIPVYTISDADLAHEILVTKAAAMAKSAGLHYLAPVLGDGLLTADGEVHKRHRKLLAPAFAPKRLAGYADVMVEETRRTVDTWRAGKQVDLAQEIMEMTLAIAGRTLFGAEVRGDAATVGRGLELAMHSTIEALASPLQLPYAFPLPRHLRMRRAVKMLDEVVFRLIADGRRRGTDLGDVLSVLLVADDEAGRLTDREIRDEVMTLLLAGHETTANALAWTWYELGRNPGALARLVAEVDHVIGTRPVTADDLPAMPWNLAVLDEAMRLHPPAYQTGRETAEPVDVGGHHFPTGSILAINIRGIHRRADYFPAPLAFLPERMLPDAKKARPRHHYLPFGAGPRVCIGSHFALLEAQLCLATMAQRATIHTLVTRVEPEPLITLRPRGGLPALVGPRTVATV
jgi:cytochrome P450